MRISSYESPSRGISEVEVVKASDPRYNTRWSGEADGGDEKSPEVIESISLGFSGVDAIRLISGMSRVPGESRCMLRVS
jgi:hypothetical protein